MTLVFLILGLITFAALGGLTLWVARLDRTSP